MIGRRRRWLGLVLVALVLLAAGAWYRLAPDRYEVTPRIRIDDVVDDLIDSLEPGAVVEQRADAPVRIADMTLGRDGPVRGEFRRALVMPVPSTVRYRVRVPPDAALQLEAGLDADEKTASSGVVLALSVDGQEMFSRVYEPGSERPRWHGRRVNLSGVASREVEIVLTSRAAGDGPSGGTPAWGRLRLVHLTRHERQQATATRPNVLVLLVDTLRNDALGCNGARPSPSPNLDALAAEGILFEQAVAQAPWTLPAVATLFSGLHPVSHGVVGGRWRWGEPDDTLDASRTTLHDSIPTLAELAQRGGITTACLTANPLVSQATGLARGFEYRAELTGNKTDTRFARAATVNERFLDWLAANREHRFFAYLHYMDTHTPYEPPLDLRPPERPDLPEAVRAGRIEEFRHKSTLSPEAVAHLRALYDGSLRYWDAELGKLRAGLARLGVADSTVIVVLADHGEGFQEHGYLGHGVHLHDELLRVPLIVAGPGITPAHRREQVQQIDFLPTVAALLGVTVPSGLPGHDLLSSPAEQPAVASTVFWMAPDDSRAEMQAWRTPHWKLFHAPATDHYELYDLVRDPGEHQDRFRELPEAAALASQLASWRATAPAAPSPDDAPHPQITEKLRALGYVQ